MICLNDWGWFNTLPLLLPAGLRGRYNESHERCRRGSLG